MVVVSLGILLPGVLLPGKSPSGLRSVKYSSSFIVLKGSFRNLENDLSATNTLDPKSIHLASGNPSLNCSPVIKVASAFSHHFEKTRRPDDPIGRSKASCFAYSSLLLIAAANELSCSLFSSGLAVRKLALLQGIPSLLWQ